MVLLADQIIPTRPTHYQCRSSRPIKERVRGGGGGDAYKLPKMVSQTCAVIGSKETLLSTMGTGAAKNTGYGDEKQKKNKYGMIIGKQKSNKCWKKHSFHKNPTDYQE